MKSIFVIPRMGGGGAERVLANQANTMTEQGHDITILTIVGGDSFYPLTNKVKYSSANVIVNRKNKITLLFTEVIGLIKSYFYFRSEIKKSKPDFVFSQQRQADIICYLVKKSGVKFNHVCYEINDPFVRPKLTKYILKRIFSESQLLVCQTQTVADFYNTVKHKIVIPNPINPTVIPIRVKPSEKRIVAVGRLDKQKNFEMLINAFSKVVKSVSDCRLDIYGEGPMRSALQYQIDKMGLKNKVTLCGAKSNVLNYICDATVFAMSSDYEGMPNALLEAMAIGLPVVSTNFKTGVAKELITDENGIVVPVNDDDSFAKALINILLSKTIYESALLSSPEKMKKFHNDIVMKKWIETFKNI